MESLTFRHTTKTPLPGSVPSAITGVVASGNLEILLERVLPTDACEVAIETPIAGYGDVWAAVVADFVARGAAGRAAHQHQRRRRASRHRIAAPAPGRPADGGLTMAGNRAARIDPDTVSWYEATARQRVGGPGRSGKLPRVPRTDRARA